MRKTLLIFWLFMLIGANAYALENKVKEQLSLLENEVSSRADYDAVKQAMIDSLKSCLYLSDTPYELYKLLYEEYKSYNYDTALFYARQMLQEAEQLHNQTMLTESHIRQAFVYLSGGLFHEAYEVLSGMLPTQETAGSLTHLPDEYLLTFARLLYDMSDYAYGAEIAAAYNARGNGYMALLANRYTPADSAAYWYPLAVIDLRNGNIDSSMRRMEEAMRDSRGSVHDRAIYASSLAHLYRSKGDISTALLYYIEAAVCDIRSSTYETVAMRMVAEMLYEEGEMELAERYIHYAMGDAQRYHARHRQVSISQLLPIIEQRHEERMQRRTLTAYILLGIVLILLMAGIVGIFLLFKNNRTIHAARQTINAINRNLSVANRIKEELLGTLLAGHSKYLSAVEKYQNDVKEHVVHRNLGELMTIPQPVDAKFQRQLLNHRLDEMLLSIFPTYVEEFNALMGPNQTMEIKPGELLNPPLRIFALIRLGITHNEVIAEILDYSINTVYAYKTRTINQSRLSPDAFYAALMHISAPEI